MSAKDIQAEEERKIRNRLCEDIDIFDILDGRIFLGKKAEQYNLIDEIGDLDAAIEDIKKNLALDDIEIVSPPQKWIDKYFDDFVNSSLFQTLRMSLLPRGLVAISFL